MSRRIIFSHYILLGIGVSLRLKHYFENRSLWLDEAWVAVDIVSRSFQQIIAFFPISNPYNPPVGFDVIAKLITQTWGIHEYALRLFPLIAAILSLILFYILIKSHLTQTAVTVALGLFVLCDPLIYYAAELKQYSSDVLIVLLLYLLADYIYRKSFSFLSLLLWGMFGAFGLWISHSSIFVFLSIGLTTTAMVIRKKEWRSLGYLCFVLLVWAVSFYFLYLNVIVPFSQNEGFFYQWKGAFTTAQPFSREWWTWTGKISLGIFADPGGLRFPILASGLFTLGGIVVLRNNPRRFFIFFLPVLLAFSAALLNRFPFKGRVLLFIVPTLCIFVAQGIHWSLARLPAYPRVFGFILLTLVFFYPVKTAVYYLSHPRQEEDMRVVMAFYKDHFLPGDFLIINDFAQPQYWYYANRLRCDHRTSTPEFAKWNGELVQGYRIGQFANALHQKNGIPFMFFRNVTCLYDNKGTLHTILADQTIDEKNIIFEHSQIDFGGQRRVWLLISHCESEIKKFVLEYLDRKGRRIKQYEGKGSAVYLYELYFNS